MMKKILIAIGFILLCMSRAHAANCPLAAGGNIASAAASCGSGNTVQLAAGSYTLNSQFTLPCGVSISGPVVPYSQTPNQTALISGSVSHPIQTTAGCSVAQSVSYVQWNGGRPSSGGGFINVVPGTNGFTLNNSYLHGSNCGTYCGDLNANQITIYGANPSQSSCCTASGAVTNNIKVLWNIFSANGDCAGALYSTGSTDTTKGGGYCNGVGMGGNLTNIVVENNIFLDADNGMKYYEAMTNYCCTGSSGYGNPVTLNYNDFQRYSRIGYEGQINWGGPLEPTLEYVQFNSFHNPINPHQQNYDISMANGCVYNQNTTSMTNCENHLDYNITVQHGSNSNCDPGFEYWGGQNSTGNGNFFNGGTGTGTLCHSFQYAVSGNFTFNNNTVYATGLGSGLCGINGNVNENSPAFTPSCSGTVNSTSTGTITSVAPILSFSGTTVTITNTNVSTPNGSNPGRDSNTTFWCTTDGTTPSAGGSNSTPYWTGIASQTAGTIAVSGSGTAKCLGMWGAPNQPYSYDSGYGYVPSAVVSIAYNTGALTPAATPTFSPSSETFTSPISVTLADTTAGATIYYTTNGSTPTITSTVYSGPISVSGITTVVQAIATASGYSQSSVGSATYTYVPAAPTLQSVSIALTGGGTTIADGGTIQAIATCTFSDGSTATSPSSKCTPSAWNSNNTAVTTSNSSGVYTGLSIGTANIWAVVGGITGSTLTVNVTSVSLSSVAISGPTSVLAGSIIDLTATCTYSDSSTTNCTNSDSHGNDATFSTSNAVVASITSAGVLQGLTSGYTNIVATVYSYGSGGNNLDDTLSNWTTCTLAPCVGGTPGGVTSPASTSQTINNSAPSLDGGSMLLSATTIPSSTQTNTLWQYSAGACDTCTLFNADFWVYLGSASAQANGFEWNMFLFDVSNGYEYIWGLKMAPPASPLLPSSWYIYNASAGTWLLTTVTTTLGTSAWHHIQIADHRVLSDTNTCTGAPCEYYDTLTLDGAPYTLGFTEKVPTLPSGYVSNTGIEYQIDIGASTPALTITENTDELTFDASYGIVTSAAFQVQVVNSSGLTTLKGVTVQGERVR